MPEYEVRELQGQHKVYAGGRYLAAVQQGRFRPFIYPVFTPAGHLVTQISPVDHLHHLSIWVGHHDVNGVNFWAPETYEVAPLPRIVIRETDTQIADDGVTFRQTIEWWNGHRNAELRETRTTTIRARDDGTVVDLVCALEAAERPVMLGQAKDAGIGLRVADQIDVLDGGRISNAEGGVNEAGTWDQVSDWVDYSGPVARAAIAGIAVFPHPELADVPWFTRDYGPVLVNPWRQRASPLAPGDSFTLGARFVAHDGSCDAAGVAGLYARFREELGR